MQVILISKKTGKTRTFDIMPRHWALAGGAFLFVLFFSSAFFSWLSIQLRLPILRDLVFQAQAQAVQDSQSAVHNNLQFMATRLGELQAELEHVKNLGQRLSNTVTPAPAPSKRRDDGKGGPLITAPLTEDTLRREIDRLARDIEHHDERMSMLEASMVERQALTRFLPTTIPVEGELGSGFGFREDPITRRRALHEGMDFRGNIGTPIMAAAGGIVVGANYHHAYGNIIVIDHGMDLVTRYAHLSRVDVEVGQTVKQGQRIGALGNTGRSTGPHLHFEVRSQGVAMNPAAFLSQGTRVTQRMPGTLRN